MSLLYDALKRLEAGGASTAGVRRAAPAGIARHPRRFSRPEHVALISAMAVLGAVAVAWVIWQTSATVPGNRAGAMPDSPTAAAGQGAPVASRIGSAPRTPTPARLGVENEAPAGNLSAILAPNGEVPESNLPAVHYTAPDDTLPRRSAPVAVRPLAKSVALVPVREAQSVAKQPYQPYPASKVMALQGGELHRDATAARITHTNAVVDGGGMPHTKVTPADTGRIAVSVVKPPLRSASGNEKSRGIASRSAQSIPLLVGQLHQAMEQGNSVQVAGMLEQLDHRVGGKSLIALRMHAYWALQQGDYHAARGYYGRVLAQRPDDLQAGGNMALLEWRSGAAAAARKRLRDLRRLYPDSKTVRRYLSTMEAGL